MKKAILYVSLILFAFGCSSDSDTDLNAQEQKIIGAWEVRSLGYINANGNETIQPLESECYNSYTFTSNKKVNYKNYWDCSDMEEENGSWSIQGNILTRKFPQDVLVVMKDSIVFVTANKIKLFEVGNNTDFTIYEMGQ